MVLVIDVGNTNLVLGVYDKGRLKHHWKIATSREKTADDWAISLKALFDFVGISFHAVKGIIISSVVPTIMYVLERMCRLYFHVKPMIIGPGIKTGLNIKYDNPKEVGADRIVNAVAALSLYESPMIIVDFGTAITYCYINENEEYVGGAIAPGVSISMEALYTEASKLPRIELTKPPNVLGKNTIHAMQAGVYYGFVGQVDGVVNRMKEFSGGNPIVIATGSLAKLIAADSKTIQYVEPLLTLKGLHMIYEKNA